MHDLSQRRAEFEDRSKLYLGDSLSLLEWNGKRHRSGKKTTMEGAITER